MSKSKCMFTPGPWSVDQYGEQVHAGDYKQSTQVHICNVFDPIKTGPIPGVHQSNKLEREANARLIAACPGMVVALERALPLLKAYGDKPWTEVAALIEQTLIKARGSE